MSVKTTVLFSKPQFEIASMISQRLSQSTSTSIVTGFATPGGLKALAGPIKARPASIDTIIIGAATYPGFEALDELIASGVPQNRLFVHLGHTRSSGTPKNPTVRFHPMLHSKIYYMEFPDGNACAFIGSHNMTSFALTGLNGEAAVLLEGPIQSVEFQQVRNHIGEARSQAARYSPSMKESLAWWTREFIDGMKAEVKLPVDCITVRTILIFAQAVKQDQPILGNRLYFEMPAGIEQIESLSTEAHLFLFEKLPQDPWVALQRTQTAHACYTCRILGADNRQGNLEVKADWQIDGTTAPVLKRVPSKLLRPNTSAGMQQVRAEVHSVGVTPFEYLFDRQKKAWDPVYTDERPIYASRGDLRDETPWHDPDDRRPGNGWKLVLRLVPREQEAQESDMLALELAAPDSGSFMLVSLRRRRMPNATERPSDTAQDLFDSP